MAAENLEDSIPMNPKIPARPLPPLSPKKNMKTSNVSELARGRKKRKERSKIGEEKESSDRRDNTQLQGKIGDNQTSQKVKPALPPRSPRKKATKTLDGSNLKTYTENSRSVPKSNDSLGNGASKRLNNERSFSLASDDSEKVGGSSHNVENYDEGIKTSQSSVKSKKLLKGKKRSITSISTSQQELITMGSSEALDENLMDLDEDIKEVEVDNPPVIAFNHLDSAPIQSQQVNKCFIEKKDLFKAVDKRTLMNIAQHQNSVGDATIELRPTRSALQLALSSHKTFKTVAFFCHGLLAGISLWQIIVMYRLSEPYHSLEDFLDHYSLLSQPMQSIFSFLLAICIVSSFDKFEFGRLDLNMLKDIFTFRHGAFVIVIYIAVFILHLAIHDTDDKINLYAYNSSWWSSFEDRDRIEHLIYRWRISNVCQCVGALIGWMMIVCYPYVDYLSKSLASLSENVKSRTKADVAAIT